MSRSHLLFEGRAARSRLARFNRITFAGHCCIESLECRTLLAVDVAPTFTVTEDWSSGFQGTIRLTSNESAPITPWRLEFDWSAGITSIWDAQIQSHVGNHYVIVPADWNVNLPAGGIVQFGFVASPGGSLTGPTNYKLNGSSLGDSAPTPPAISVEDIAVLEGPDGLRVGQFTLRMSHANEAPVTVTYSTTDGSASAGSDFVPRSGTLTFAPGQTAAIIPVTILGDRTVEPDELFYLDLSGPLDATLSRMRATGTIRNDDVSAQPASAEYRVLADWGAGFTAQVTVHNTTGQSASEWRVAFDFTGKIASVWNGVIESHAGTRYVIRHAGYTSTLAPGASTSFGFLGTPSGSELTNLTAYFNGQQPPNRAPLAVTDAAVTRMDQSALIPVLSNDSDADGDAISLIAVQVAAHGAVSLESGAIRYTPANGFTGADSFTYQIRDSRGATSTGTVNVTVSPIATVAAQMFAPYVDITLWPTYDLVAAARDQHIQYFTLAFITADPQNKPAWGGYSAYALGSEFDTGLKTQITAVRALGGDVIVSFGGASNQELAEVITDVATLQAAYQAVIDAHNLTHIDFDIEGAAIAQRDSVDRRNLAIAGLQQAAAAAGRTLTVSYTLPVLPTGLTPDGVYLLQSAATHGVTLDIVNVMAMDYGDSAAPNPQGRMGDYAIQAATSLFNQLKTVYGTAKSDNQLWAMVGITPMIGLNDVTTETFDQQEAREVLAFAEQRGIGRLSFWSLNRDRQNASGTLGYVDLFSSSILQSPFEFSQIFGTFDD
jgi:hypothetical protein